MWIAAGVPLLAAIPASSTCVNASWIERFLGLAHADPSCAEGSALGPSALHLLLACLALAAALAGTEAPLDRPSPAWPTLPVLLRLPARACDPLTPSGAHIPTLRSRGPPGQPCR